MRASETIKLLVISDENDSGPFKVPLPLCSNQCIFWQISQQFSALIYYSTDLSTHEPYSSEVDILVMHKAFNFSIIILFVLK